MAILITSPIEVHLLFQKGSNFSIEEVFLLAQAIDEYEIEMEVSSTVVVDIRSISSDGETVLLITPKANVSYEMLSEHLRGITTHIMKHEKFTDIDTNLGSVQFLTLEPGMPSEMFTEVESIRRIKADMITTQQETQQKLNESKKILDEILRMQKKPPPED
jgi:hypothetical protein